MPISHQRRFCQSHGHHFNLILSAQAFVILMQSTDFFQHLVKAFHPTRDGQVLVKIIELLFQSMARPAQYAALCRIEGASHPDLPQINESCFMLCRNVCCLVVA